MQAKTAIKSRVFDLTLHYVAMQKKQQKILTANRIADKIDIFACRLVLETKKISCYMCANSAVKVPFKDIQN